MALVAKNLPASAGDMRDACSIPRLGRSPGGGHGNPVQYCCLENPVDGGAWRAQSIGSQRVRQDWSDLARTHAWMTAWKGRSGYQQVRGWSDSFWNWRLNKEESEDRSGWIVRNCRSRGWINKGPGKWKSLYCRRCQLAWEMSEFQRDGNVCGAAAGMGCGAVGLEVSVVCGNTWVLRAARLRSLRAWYCQGVSRRASVSAGDSVRRGREVCVLTAGALQGLSGAEAECGRSEPAVTSGSRSCSQRFVRCENACSFPPAAQQGGGPGIFSRESQLSGFEQVGELQDVIT